MTHFFEQKPLLQASFLQRLFRQPVKQNALIEINNELARHSITSVSTEWVRSVHKKYKINPKRDFLQNRKELYAVACYHLLLDLNSREKPNEVLKHLGALLHLPPLVLQRTNEQTAQFIYQYQVSSCIVNRRLDTSRRQKLGAWRRWLMLNEATANKILSETCGKHLQGYLKNVVANERLSPQEDAELQAMVKSFNIRLNMNAETQEKLNRYRQYWHIEHGSLAPIAVSISLPKTEQCFLEMETDWLELRTVTHRVNYGGVSARAKIMKGVYYRVGSMKAEAVKSEEWKLIDQGTLFLTNKRIIFMGSKGNKNIRLNRVLSFSPFQNGVEIDKDSGKSPFLQLYGDIDLFSMLLSRLLRDE